MQHLVAGARRRLITRTASQDESGVSLIELLIVIVIIGLLSTVITLSLDDSISDVASDLRDSRCFIFVGAAGVRANAVDDEHADWVDSATLDEMCSSLSLPTTAVADSSSAVTTSIPRDQEAPSLTSSTSTAAPITAERDDETAVTPIEGVVCTADKEHDCHDESGDLRCRIGSDGACRTTTGAVLCTMTPAIKPNCIGPLDGRP